jgi:hypothetical protein
VLHWTVPSVTSRRTHLGDDVFDGRQVGLALAAAKDLGAVQVDLEDTAHLDAFSSSGIFIAMSLDDCLLGTESSYETENCS